MVLVLIGLKISRPIFIVVLDVQQEKVRCVHKYQIVRGSYEEQNWNTKFSLGDANRIDIGFFDVGVWPKR